MKPNYRPVILPITTEALDPLGEALKNVDGCSSSPHNESNLSDSEVLTPNSTEKSEIAESITSGPGGGMTKCKSNYDYHFRRDWVDKLMPDEVRWFYKEPTEKQWIPFIGYDSMRIETKYQDLTVNGCPQCELRKQQRQEKLHHSNSENLNSFGHARLSITSIDDEEITDGESCAEKVIVRGSLFEVNVTERKMTPIYWSGVIQTARIIRGTWFKNDNWEPLDEDLSAKIEEEHLRQFEGVFINELSSQPTFFTDKKKTGCEGMEGDMLDANNDIKKQHGSYGPLAKTLVSSSVSLLTAIHVLKFAEFHVDWYDLDEIYLYSESASLFIRQKLGMQKVGTRLRRGYHTLASMDDKPPDITQLCFVIHGIGQKILTGAIIKSCADLRESCDRIKARFFPDLDSANQRVEFLPVEWRSALRLDGDTVDSITPTHLRSLRTLLNSSAMDILYYTSPLYRSEIMLGLKAELNRLYSMFCARHPYFEANGGKVSIVAHSLGTVITYDIIMGGLLPQNHSYEEYREKANIRSADMGEFSRCLKEMEEARKKMVELEEEMMNLAGRDRIASHTNTFRQANFPNNFKTGSIWKNLPKLQNLFCLGSPLAVFLALRGIRPINTGTQEHILPRNICQRLFNIYHPADPVAYRIEPLLLKHYSTIQPVMIYRWDAKVKVNYDALAPEIIKTDKKKKTFQVPRNSSGGTIKDNLHSVESSDDFERYQRSISGQSNYAAVAAVDGNCKSLKEESECCSEAENPTPLANDSAVDVELTANASLGSRFLNLFQRSRSGMEKKLPPVGNAVILRESSERCDSPSMMRHISVEASMDSELRDFRPTVMQHRPDLGSFSVHKPTASSPDLIHFDQEAFHKPPLLKTSSDAGFRCASSASTGSNGSTSVDLYAAGKDSTHLEHRIDYQLRESRYESSYLSVLTSHTAYWTNPDVGMFIMTHLFPQYGPIGIPKPAKL